MDNYTACSIAEGFCEGENASNDEQGTAWQWLLDTGLCWKLQGFYGRTVTDLLEAGLLLPPKKDQEDFYGNLVRGKGE